MIYLLLREWFAGRHYAYENTLFRGIIAALFCFLLMLVLTPRFVRQLIKWKMGDRPEFDHASLNELTKEKKNVPTMGGLMIMSVIGLAVLLLADVGSFYIQMGLVCLVWLVALGGMDDWLKLTRARDSRSRDGLRSWEKLLFQIGLGVVMGAYIYMHGRDNLAVVIPMDDSPHVPSYRILSVPFYKPGIQLSALAFIILTVLVMTGTSNAVNFTDGMDGLASGCVAMCALVFLIFSYIVGSRDLAEKLLFPYIPHAGELVVVCGAILGAALGFLWYNCHPAKVFMGDAGSLPLGGLIGYVAVVTRQELMLVIAGGVFVMEALSVISQIGYFKWTRGKRLFRCAPIHHHFHLSGWSEPQTVVRFWLVSALFAGLALATIKLR